MNGDNIVSRAINWPFLDEPLYRWGIFLVALGCMGAGWRGVLNLMKE